MAFRILFLSPVLLVAVAAMISFSAPARAQTPTFSNGCTSINAGVFNINGPGTLMTPANFNAGERIVATLVGNIVNSLLRIGTTTLFNGATTGSVFYDVTTTGSLTITRDIQINISGQMTFRCEITPTTAPAPAPAPTTTTTTTTTPPTPTGPTAQQFQWAGDWTIGIVEQSVGGLFQSNFPYREAKDLLFGNSLLGEYGVFTPPAFDELGNRYTYNFDGFFNHHELSRTELERLRNLYFELKQKKNPWPQFFENRSGTGDSGNDWNGLSADDEDEFKRLRKILHDAGYLPREEADGLEGGVPLGYAPVETPPALYISGYDGNGQIGGRHSLVKNNRYAVWFEGGILTSVSNGVGGQSRTVGGGKFGFAARLTKRVAFNSDVYVANGSFKVPGSSLTGGFTEVGATMGPVIKLGKGLFLALSGRFARTEVDQTISGVTGDFNATRYAGNILLGGHYVAGQYILEPEVSATFRKSDGGNYITSSGLTVTGVDSSSTQIRGGARVSRLTKVSDSLPVLAPFVASYASWHDFNAITAGGADVGGFSMTISTGVDIPVGYDSNLNLALTVSNLFGDSGETIGGLIKFDKRW